MSELIKIITEWPAIAQGALGSFVFWLFLTYIPKLIFFITENLSNKSLKIRKRKLQTDLFKYRALNSKKKLHQIYALSGLNYACLRKIIPGFLWLTLGLIFMNFIEIFSIVGFLGAIYYFILAQRIVAPINTDLVVEQEIANLEAEIEMVTQKLNKQINKDT